MTCWTWQLGPIPICWKPYLHGVYRTLSRNGICLFTHRWQLVCIAVVLPFILSFLLSLLFPSFHIFVVCSQMTQGSSQACYVLQSVQLASFSVDCPSSFMVSSCPGILVAKLGAYLLWSQKTLAPVSNCTSASRQHRLQVPLVLGVGLSDISAV